MRIEGLGKQSRCEKLTIYKYFSNFFLLNLLLLIIQKIYSSRVFQKSIKVNYNME